MVGEKLPVDIEDVMQGQLQFECLSLLSARYRELVHWLQVSMNTHDSRLTFATLTLATCSHTGIGIPYILIKFVSFSSYFAISF